MFIPEIAEVYNDLRTIWQTLINYNFIFYATVSVQY